MKNRWIEYCFGIITVKIVGQDMEHFFNKLTEHNLIIWDIRRHSTEIMTFKMKLKDVKKLRMLRRESNCKISFVKREGIPFLLQRLFKNSGIITGAVLFLFIIFILSNVIWKIDVNGASPQVEQKVYKQLQNLGIKVGSLQFFVDDVESVQRKLTNSIDEITWIGVELTGTKYQFTVVEKEQPEAKELTGPQNLIAKKKALIVNMFVEDGQIEVKVNDYVQKGQMLVSGTIGKEGEEKHITAKGKIFGETWYKSNVKIPLEMTTSGLSGNVQRYHFLKIGNINIPIWGHRKLMFKTYQLEKSERPAFMLQRKLPFSYVKKIYREKERVTRVYSKEDAIELALKLARKDLLNKLEEDATIKGEKVLHQTIDNGKVSLKIHFEVIENIGIGQPIIQGD